MVFWGCVSDGPSTSRLGWKVSTERARVRCDLSESEAEAEKPFPSSGVSYTASRRMSPQGISVGVSGVILRIIRSLNVPGVIISR